ncbi:MAG: hypothetical protein R3C69_05835, partial [Geminicoccaceae bacterium]
AGIGGEKKEQLKDLRLERHDLAAPAQLESMRVDRATVEAQRHATLPAAIIEEIRKLSKISPDRLQAWQRTTAYSGGAPALPPTTH